MQICFLLDNKTNECVIRVAGPLLDDKEKDRCAQLMQYRGKVPEVSLGYLTERGGHKEAWAKAIFILAPPRTKCPVNVLTLAQFCWLLRLG